MSGEIDISASLISKAIWKQAREAQYCVGDCLPIQVQAMLPGEGNQLNTSHSNLFPFSWLGFLTHLCFLSPAQIRDNSAVSSPSQHQATYFFFDKAQYIIDKETLIPQWEAIIIIFQPCW